MNIEQTKEAIRVMQAFVDGKEVEYERPDGIWTLINNPVWNWNTQEYRIKPTAKLRPWTADEVPLGGQRRVKTIREYRWLIDRTSDQLVRNEWLSTSEHSTDGGKTWLPCGVMEEAK